MTKRFPAALLLLLAVVVATPVQAARSHDDDDDDAPLYTLRRAHPARAQAKRPQAPAATRPKAPRVASADISAAPQTPPPAANPGGQTASLAAPAPPSPAAVPHDHPHAPAPGQGAPFAKAGNAPQMRACLTRRAQELLERIEAQFGPVRIVSTCRPGSVIPGSGVLSRHHYREAIDFEAGKRKAEVVRWLIANHKTGGIMTYSNFSHIHVDIGYRFVALNAHG
jgi:hypothetical protein